MKSHLLVAEPTHGAVRVLASEWVHLSQAALCLEADCETIFRIQSACPRCGGRSWVLLSTFLREKR